MIGIFGRILVTNKVQQSQVDEHERTSTGLIDDVDEWRTPTPVSLICLNMRQITPLFKVPVRLQFLNAAPEGP